MIRDDFIERLKQVILDYEAAAARLEKGEKKISRTLRIGRQEDISLETARHYRRQIAHYKEIVSRHEAKKDRTEVLTRRASNFSRKP